MDQVLCVRQELLDLAVVARHLPRGGQRSHGTCERDQSSQWKSRRSGAAGGQTYSLSSILPSPFVSIASNRSSASGVRDMRVYTTARAGRRARETRLWGRAKSVAVSFLIGGRNRWVIAEIAEVAISTVRLPSRGHSARARRICSSTGQPANSTRIHATLHYYCMYVLFMSASVNSSKIVACTIGGGRGRRAQRKRCSSSTVAALACGYGVAGVARRSAPGRISTMYLGSISAAYRSMLYVSRQAASPLYLCCATNYAVSRVHLRCTSAASPLYRDHHRAAPPSSTGAALAERRRLLRRRSGAPFDVSPAPSST